MAFDFPNNPALNDIWATPAGVIYAWNGYAWVRSGASFGNNGPGDFVLKAGDVMTGSLTLSGDPSAALHATTKQYVDARGSLPLGSVQGEVLVLDPALAPVWGAPIDGGTF